MSDLLVVKNLCKEGILKNISFSVNTGEMVSVMGSSGSGKSTLLYQVSSMDRADSRKRPRAGAVKNIWRHFPSSWDVPMRGR